MTTNAKSKPDKEPSNVVALPRQAAKKPSAIYKPPFRILPYTNPRTKGQSWRVTGYLRDGKRVRENFDELAKAEARKSDLEIDWYNREAETRLVATKLTDSQLKLAEAAFLRLDNEADIFPAIDYWLRHGKHLAVANTVKLDEAWKQFETWVDGCGELRDLSKRNLKRRVKVFVNSVPNCKVSDFTPKMIRGYLAKRIVSAKSKNNDRRAVSRFFSWCIDEERGWIAMNPCREAKVKIPKGAPRPAILSVEECERFVRAAEAHKDGRLVPYIALSLFAGLRPFEVARLSWRAVNLTDNEIRLEAEETKTGRLRVVPVSETLKAWLTAYQGKPINPSNWRRDLDAIKEAAGLVKRETAKSKEKIDKVKKGKLVKARRYWKRLTPVSWAPDIMRHTAISHYFRKTGSYGLTAEWAGNSEKMIKDHYQGLVRTPDMEKFYALRPWRQRPRGRKDRSRRKPRGFR